MLPSSKLDLGSMAYQLCGRAAYVMPLNFSYIMCQLLPTSQNFFLFSAGHTSSVFLRYTFLESPGWAEVSFYVHSSNHTCVWVTVINTSYWSDSCTGLSFPRLPYSSLRVECFNLLGLPRFWSTSWQTVHYPLKTDITSECFPTWVCFFIRPWNCLDLSW